MKSSNNIKIVVNTADCLDVSNSVVSDRDFKRNQETCIKGQTDSRFKKKRKVSIEKNLHSGRPNSLNETKLNEMLKLYYTRPYSFRELADIFGVSRMTVWRAVQTAQSFVSLR